MKFTPFLVYVIIKRIGALSIKLFFCRFYDKSKEVINLLISVLYLKLLLSDKILDWIKKQG